MTDKQIIEEMARLEGCHKFGSLDLDFSCMRYDEDDEVWMVRISESCGMMHMPDYLTSHDAVQPVIDGLGDKYTQGAYCFELRDICSTKHDNNWKTTVHATPRQKCEAILKAKGLWE